MTDEHFKGCHPEDGKAPKVPGREPTETEGCWHCQTPTSRGCRCGECWDGEDGIAPSAIYHCALCGRWWAYMELNITEIRVG